MRAFGAVIAVGCAVFTLVIGRSMTQLINTIDEHLATQQDLESSGSRASQHQSEANGEPKKNTKGGLRRAVTAVRLFPPSCLPNCPITN